MIIHVPHMATTTTGAGLVPYHTTGTTAALRCGTVRPKMGSTAAATTPVPNMVQNISGATQITKTAGIAAVLLMIVTQL